MSSFIRSARGARASDAGATARGRPIRHRRGGAFNRSSMKSLLRRALAAPIKRVAIRVAERVEAWRRDALPEFANSPRNLTIELPRTICLPQRIRFRTFPRCRSGRATARPRLSNASIRRS